MFCNSSLKSVSALGFITRHISFSLAISTLPTPGLAPSCWLRTASCNDVDEIAYPSRFTTGLFSVGCSSSGHDHYRGRRAGKIVLLLYRRNGGERQDGPPANSHSYIQSLHLSPTTFKIKCPEGDWQAVIIDLTGFNVLSARRLVTGPSVTMITPGNVQ